MNDGHGLVPLDDVSGRLGLKGQSYVGFRPIPIERIIGTVDRDQDFDREFRPRKGHIGQRLASVRRAFPAGDFPPKRVAGARQMGMASIDAEVIRLETEYEFGPDVDIRQLIHTEQHRLFMEQTGLELVRPRARIEFSRPQGYRELLEIVKAHGFDLTQQAGSWLEPHDVAERWYDDTGNGAISSWRTPRSTSRRRRARRVGAG